MIKLMFIMLERISIIVAAAFILTRFNFFKNIINHHRLERKHIVMAIISFGLFGIMGTYLGFTFNVLTSNFESAFIGISDDAAIANFRVIGVVLAGLLGGYRMGIGAGLIAGIHRITLGGFTALSCGLSTIIAGIISGKKYKSGERIKPLTGFLVGSGAESLQMGLIIALSSPFEKSIALVQVIGLPMVLANGIGTALFIIIIDSVENEREKATALQAQKTLRIADRTLGHLQQGLNNLTATAVCNILYKELKPAAVAVTDEQKILAHVGIASDHHKVNQPFRTEETKNVFVTGQLTVIREGTVHCDYPNCPLKSVIIAPLTYRHKVIGTLKIYYATASEIKDATIELIDGLSSLLSNQLAIAKSEQAYQLASIAEIKVLQAQIRPHFLFNSINIIMSLIRTDPAQARRLLKSLSNFLRQNVKGATATHTTLRQELAHVKSYLEIFEARFVDRLHVKYQVNQELLDVKIPPLTLQPIVENAINHAFNHRVENCQIKITIEDLVTDVLIQIKDNGRGISRDKLPYVGRSQNDSEKGTGVGLYNVRRRLKIMFDDEAQLNVHSKINQGTTVKLLFPKRKVI